MTKKSSRQPDEELARLREYAAVIDGAEDAIFVTTLDGTIVSWNPGAEQLFGHAAGDILGKPVDLLAPPGRRDEVRAALERIGRGERPGAFESERRRADGGIFAASIAVSPIRDTHGRITGAAAIARDLAKTKRTDDRLRLSEEQIRQANKMEAIGQLAGGVAHDFNNLLTIVAGYSEIVLKRLGRDDPARELVLEIQRAGERAAALTRQLLAFSRKQVLEFRILDLNAVVADTEKMLRRLIGEDITLTTVLDPALGAVKADRNQIEQVLLNLAVNARDAMPQGGKLTIETRNVDLDAVYVESHRAVTPGPYVMLALTDTGCGMDATIKARIFEPFFTTKGPGKGTGLGLATVYGIVKQSGGYIWVYSEVNQGTSFKVYLPLVQEKVASGRSLHGLRASPAGNETILLVEDEDAVRAITRYALTNLGYTVLEASSGAQALQICESHPGPIPLVLSDVVMPEMGGRELVEALSRKRPGIKVLYLSGYTDDAVVRHGVLEAETAFLQKPFTPFALANKVREVLDK